MKPLLRALVCLWLAFAAPSAFAQCEGTWNTGRIGETLNQVDAALVEADLGSAKSGLASLDKGWPCIEDFAYPPILAQYARDMGLLRFYEQDEPQAIKWGLYARALDPNGAWPGELGSDHPYMALLDEEEPASETRAEGWLVPPEGGAIFVNGKFAPEPTAFGGVPAFVQHFDKVGYPVQNYWQDGAAFLEEAISAEGEATPPPKFWDPETGEVKVSKEPAKVKLEKIKVEKAPSDFPVVPVATAGGLAAVSGITYALAGATSSSLANATTEDQLTRARSTTNVLVLISAVTGAGAIGVGTGTVLATGNGVMWNVKF